MPQTIINRRGQPWAVYTLSQRFHLLAFLCARHHRPKDVDLVQGICQLLLLTGLPQHPATAVVRESDFEFLGLDFPLSELFLLLLDLLLFFLQLLQLLVNLLLFGLE
jgi:hypothetical protein